MNNFTDLIKKFLSKYNLIFLSIIKTYFIVIGFFWIGIFLYFRLFQSRSSYLLIDIKEYLNYKILLIYLTFVMIHFSILLGILIDWYRNKYNKKPNNYIVILYQKLAKVIDIIYWKPLDTIYIKYHRKIPGSARFFLLLEKSWTKKQCGKYYFYFIIFLFDMLPKIIMAIIFFIDIVIYGQVKYFFWVIPLVFIPIMFKIFIKLMVSFSNNNIPVLSNYFSEIVGIGEATYYKNLSFPAYRAYSYTVKDEYLGVIDPSEEMQYILQLKRILIYMDGLKTDKEFFELYTTIFTSILYLIAGVIRLFIIYF